VAEPAGDRRGPRPDAPQPDRYGAAGLGLQLEVTDAVLTSLLGVAGARPASPDDLDGFGEAVDLLGGRQRRAAQRHDLLVHVAGPQPEDEPAARQQVQG